MYLNMLDNEKKELFLDLCICLSESDGDFSQEEKITINKFCAEMNIIVRYKSNYDIETTLIKLNDICNNFEKRAIVLEVLGIVMADNKYAEEERVILENLSEKFLIDYNEIEKMIQVVADLYKIYEKFNLFLNGESI